MVKIIRIGMLAVFALVLASCAKQMLYPAMSMDNVTEQQKRKDAFECKTMAVDFKSKYEGGGSPSFGHYGMAAQKRRSNDATDAANDYYVECMQVRGYKLVPQ